MFIDLQSFITQDEDDRDFLVKNLKSFNVPILNYVADGSRQREPFQISEKVSVTSPHFSIALELTLAIKFDFHFFALNRCVLLVSSPDWIKFLMLLMLSRRF